MRYLIDEWLCNGKLFALRNVGYNRVRGNNRYVIEYHKKKMYGYITVDSLEDLKDLKEMLNDYFNKK